MEKAENVAAIHAFAADVATKAENVWNTDMIYQAPKALAYIDIIRYAAINLKAFAEVEADHDARISAAIEAFTRRVHNTAQELGLAQGK